MKKTKKAALIAATFAVALNINACVYGPAGVQEVDSSETTAVVETEKEPEETEEVTEEETEEETEATLIKEFDPSAQEEVCVYGPPATFDE
ncbi:MAG: hypothetical protein MJ153_06170 [Clostridia bacterium]|nr:hypothetical protein [Clostridia bacterium]